MLNTVGIFDHLVAFEPLRSEELLGRQIVFGNGRRDLAADVFWSHLQLRDQVCADSEPLHLVSDRQIHNLELDRKADVPNGSSANGGHLNQISNFPIDARKSLSDQGVAKL